MIAQRRRNESRLRALSFALLFCGAAFATSALKPPLPQTWTADNGNGIATPFLDEGDDLEKAFTKQ